MAKPYLKAALGGTFDNFHDGHKILISTACELAADAFIGVISDEFGKSLFQRKVFYNKIQPEGRRAHSVQEFLKENRYNAKVDFIHDPYGPSISDQIVDLLVVSQETRTTADKINDIRRSNNLHELDIVTIPWYFTDSGVKISSTIIRRTKYG